MLSKTEEKSNLHIILAGYVQHMFCASVLVKWESIPLNSGKAYEELASVLIMEYLCSCNTVKTCHHILDLNGLLCLGKLQLSM